MLVTFFIFQVILKFKNDISSKNKCHSMLKSNMACLRKKITTAMKNQKDYRHKKCNFQMLQAILRTTENGRKVL